MLYVLVSNSVYYYSQQPHSLKTGPQPYGLTTHAYECMHHWTFSWLGTSPLSEHLQRI